MTRRAALFSTALAAALLLAGVALGADAAAGGEVARPVWKTAFMGFGFLLLFLALAWLPSAFAVAWRRLAGQPKAWLLGLGGVVLAGAVLRLFVVPHNVVTEYMGYLLTNRAAEMVEIPRYGVGAQVLWRSAFQIFPTDHATGIFLHAVLGSLTLVWIPAALLRAGMRPAGALAATALAAFLPQFLWADASDSLTVPVLFFTFGSILFAQEAVGAERWATKQWSSLAGAVLWLAFAANVRPEHVVFGPLLVLVFVAMGGSGGLRERLRAPLVAWVVAIAGFVVLVVPEILYAFHMRDVMTARGGWPHTFAEILPDLPSLLLRQNAIIDARIVPLALGPLALLGLVTAPDWPARRLRLSLLLLGLVWMNFYYIDLSVASAPRLHVVLTLPAALVAGAFLGDLWRLRPAKAWWLGPAIGLAALAGLGAGVPNAAGWLFQTTNEAEEDHLFREAVAALPTDEPFVLVRMGPGDKEEGDDTHLHHPDYLVRPPARKGYVMSIAEILKRDQFPERPVFFYKGLRCYSRLRREDEPPPASYYAPACGRMDDGYVLEPVFERGVSNHGDLMLPYYSTAPEFAVGLYRVKGVRQGAERAVAGARDGAPGDGPATEPGLPQTKVIPRGQEALVTKMLGADQPLADGCRYWAATIEVTFVRGRYACPGGEAIVELHAADTDLPAAAKTAQFSIVTDAKTPRGLVDAIASLVRAHESEWTWAEANAPGAAADAPESVAEQRREAPKDVTPEFREKYQRINDLYRERKHAEALPLCIELARERPEWGGILGMLVANLAPTQPDAARVEELAAAADAAPDDVLAQFMAGVSAHYSAHYKAETVEQKKELYRQAIRYLERALPHYDFEPRVFIYLAVSHFRLGLQDKAEQYIEKALTLDRKDPDAFYCRAEIFQRKDTKRSLEDLQTYLDMTSGPENVTQGEKAARVQRMKEKLEARLDGEDGDEELWDPLAGD